MGNKWDGRFWKDLLDREIALGGSAIIGVLTANSSDVLHAGSKVWLTLVGVPLAVNALKCMVMNASSGTDSAPSASFASVSSNGT